MLASTRILLIDDDESFRTVLQYNLQQAGYQVVPVTNGGEAIARLKVEPFGVAISDIKMPGIDGMEVLKWIRREAPETLVIMMTAYGSIEMAVEAIRVGAYDYVTKPINREALLATLDKAVHYRALREENLRLKEELGERYHAEQIIAASAAMKELVNQIPRIAESDATVLVTGETGTGKDLVARAIHYNSPRREYPLVAVNCAAIPSELLESELFGHARGAFTGATRDHRGKFLSANRGTLFLDEIGALEIGLQAKLLRVLQDQQVTRIGEERSTRVDVRVVAATNTDLRAEMDAGRFREDLYYRLNVIPIHIPPLRDRAEDIPVLVNHFVRRYAPSRSVTIDPGVLDAFVAYGWPGNVRELQNAIERMLIFLDGETLAPALLPKEILRDRGQIALQEKTILTLPEEGVSLEDLERRIVAKALEINGWNQARTARFLRIPRHVLLYRMEKYQISPASQPGPSRSAGH